MSLFSIEALPVEHAITWKGWAVCGLLVLARWICYQFPRLVLFPENSLHSGCVKDPLLQSPQEGQCWLTRPPCGDCNSGGFDASSSARNFREITLASDAVFACAALATALVGALTSAEMSSAAFNPLMGMLLCAGPLVLCIRLPFRDVTCARLIAAIHWPILLFVFSGGLFYAAWMRSGLSASIAQMIPSVPVLFPVFALILLWVGSWISSMLLPAPIVFALLFSVAEALNAKEPFSLIAAACTIGCGISVHWLKKFEITTRFRKWKSQVGTRFGSF